MVLAEDYLFGCRMAKLSRQEPNSTVSAKNPSTGVGLGSGESGAGSPKQKGLVFPVLRVRIIAREVLFWRDKTQVQFLHVIQALHWGF